MKKDWLTNSNFISTSDIKYNHAYLDQKFILISDIVNDVFKFHSR